MGKGEIVSGKYLLHIDSTYAVLLCLRGNKKLGSSREFVRTLLSDPFTKEF